MENLEARVAEAVKALFAANEAYSQAAFGSSAEQTLGPPARPDDLDALEITAGFALPPTYRTFLALYDGWKGFRGEIDMLSCADRNDPKMMKTIREVFELTATDGSVPKGAFFVSGGVHASSFAYLAPGAASAEGEREVVAYSIEDGELERYPDFAQYLEDSAKLMQELADEETGSA